MILLFCSFSVFCLKGDSGGPSFVEETPGRFIVTGVQCDKWFNAFRISWLNNVYQRNRKRRTRCPRTMWGGQQSDPLCAGEKTHTLDCREPWATSKVVSTLLILNVNSSFANDIPFRGELCWNAEFQKRLEKNTYKKEGSRKPEKHYKRED